MPETETPSANTFAWLTAGVVAFTIYGSLVPFHFHEQSLESAIQGFRWVLETRSGIESRSDFVANFLLGVPLGFCLLAAVRLDRPADVTRSLIIGLPLWWLCVAFAAVVEFLQLFFPDRTCAGSDIIAQGLGSLTGILIWIAFGDRLVRRFRRVWTGDRIGGTAGRIFIAYLGVLAMVLWLPLDLTLSPADVYHKFRDGKVILVPFDEITRPGGPGLITKLPTWIELACLDFSAGLLAGFIHRPRWNNLGQLGNVVIRGALLALIFEAGQIFVMSRTSSITDVLIGTLGFTLGWLLVRVLQPPPGRGISTNLGLLLIQAWAGLLLIANWLPLDFDRAILDSKLAAVNWVPFAAAYEKNYLSSLEEAATKTLLFAPLGAAVAAIGVRRVVRKRHALVLGVLVAAIVESGQLLLPSRVANPTDLIFGGAGAWLGAATALRIRAFNAPPRNPVRFKVT